MRAASLLSPLRRLRREGRRSGPDAAPRPRAAALRGFARSAASLTTALSVLVLARGWIGAERLDALLPGSRFAAPNAVLINLLSGLALLALIPAPLSRTRAALGRALAAAGALWAALFLVEFLLRRDLGIDRIFGQLQASPAAAFPGRPAFQTAAALLLPGASLLLIDSRAPWGRRLAPALALLAAAVAFIALLGQAFAAGQHSGLSGPLPYVIMAPVNAVSLLALSAGILAARPEAGPMPLLLSDDIGGTASRRLLLGLLAFSPFVVLLEFGQHRGWYSATSELVLIVSGALVQGTAAILLTGRRLNELSRANRRLGEMREQERFKLALESAATGMVMVDRQGRIVLVNGEAERLFGYTQAELSGRLIELLVPQRFRAGHPARRESFFNEPTAARPLGRGRDLFALRKNGEEVPVEIGITRINGTKETFAVAAVTDITERKNAETALRRMVEELEGFAYTVSHDLRAPLRAIQGYAHTVAGRMRGLADGETISMLERIDLAAIRMDRLIQDVLSYSAIARRPFVPERVSLDAIVADVIAVSPELRKAGVGVRGVLGAALGQPSLLSQIVSSLLDNAVKFLPPDRPPVIEVWTEDAGGGALRLVVSDNGEGVPAEHLDRIFKPLERLPAAGGREGTGIGLAIVRRAAERMGGRAGATSRPGEGSRFWVELPRA